MGAINREGLLTIFIGFIVVILVMPLLITSCDTRYDQPNDKLGITVTILPQAEFVESVGGDRITVNVMVPPGESPHTYEPKPRQMKALSESEIYTMVGSGIEFELVWMDKFISANEEMLIVDCSDGIQLQKVEYGEETTKYEPIDPHIWMSPLNARVMVQNIADGLIQIDPDNQSFYANNRDIYLQKLIQLDEDIASALSDKQNRTFMVDHPAFGYFAREYELNMLSIASEGKEPTAAGLVHLINQARENNVKIIFASPQFPPTSAEVVADAIDASLVFIDPLAEDYLSNMRMLMYELEQVME